MIGRVALVLIATLIVAPQPGFAQAAAPVVSTPPQPVASRRTMLGPAPPRTDLITEVREEL